MLAGAGGIAFCHRMFGNLYYVKHKIPILVSALELSGIGTPAPTSTFCSEDKKDMTSQELADLKTQTELIKAGDHAAALKLLTHRDWIALESRFWNASHPLPSPARQALNTYKQLCATLWQRAGLGQSEPIALYKTTLQSTPGIHVALRLLARLYAGCNLGYSSPPAGFWRTLYVLTGYIISDRFHDSAGRQSLIDQTLQLWLMAWLNPLALAPGRLPMAVRLVGILSRSCNYTMNSPTHAGSGLAAADLLSDIPPMPFARVPQNWKPTAPLYINAQDAAFTIKELSLGRSSNLPGDIYDTLLQSALEVGLTQQELQDFVRRAMREFAYSNPRNIPRFGTNNRIHMVAGFIDCWGAVQSQTKLRESEQRDTQHQAATIINQSETGFLLRFESPRPTLSVGTLVCIRGHDTEPWIVAAVRWLEDSDGTVLAGCEMFCNYADAKIAQSDSDDSHSPIITFARGDATIVLTTFDSADRAEVQQLTVGDQSWILAAPSESGEDWQARSVLDTTMLI